MDQFDERVKEVNLLLHQFVHSKTDLFLTRNSNLRNPDFYSDDGYHLTHSITPRFASNIKRALRGAHGLKEPDKATPLSKGRSNDTAPTINRYPYDQASLERIRNEVILQIFRAFQYSGT